MRLRSPPCSDTCFTLPQRRRRCEGTEDLRQKQASSILLGPDASLLGGWGLPRGAVGAVADMERCLPRATGTQRESLLHVMSDTLLCFSLKNLLGPRILKLDSCTKVHIS